MDRFQLNYLFSLLYTCQKRYRTTWNHQYFFVNTMVVDGRMGVGGGGINEFAVEVCTSIKA